MAVLTNKSIASTYTSLLSIGSTSTSSLGSSIQSLTDGTGQLSPLAMSTTQIQFNTSTNTFLFPSTRGTINQILKLSDNNGTLAWGNDILSNQLNTAGNTGTGSITLDSQSLTLTGTANEIATNATAQSISIGFPTAGVTLPNNSIATTQLATDTSTKIATTKYVTDAIGDIVIPTGDVTKINPITANQIAVWNDSTDELRSDPTIVVGTDHSITLLQTNAAGTDVENYNIGGGNVPNNDSSPSSTIIRKNTGFGKDNLNSLTDGLYNVAVGHSSLKANTGGASNVAIGYESLLRNITGGENIAIGLQSMQVNLSGDGNVAIGRLALGVNTADKNTSVGWQSGATNTSGQFNSYLGYLAGAGNTTGDQNVAIGREAAYYFIGGNNTSIGAKSLFGVNAQSTGTGNTALGYNSGSAMTTGSNNVIIGSNTGSTIATLSNNIIISDGGGNNRIQVDSGGVTSLFTNQAKTVASNVEYALLGKTDEATNYGALQLLQKGATNAADRIWSFQTIDAGIANAGNIALQPSGGNVGIGNNLPQYPLQVKSGNNINFAISTGVADGTAVRLNAVNDAVDANIPMEFYATKFNFNLGNVGIGTSTLVSSAQLTVKGNYHSDFIRNHTSGNRGYALRFGAAILNSSDVIGAQISGTLLNSNNDGEIEFYTKSSGTLAERLRISSTGLATFTPSGEFAALFENTNTAGGQHCYVDIKSNGGSNGLAILRFKTDVAESGGTSAIIGSQDDLLFQTGVGDAYSTKMSISSGGRTEITTSSNDDTLILNNTGTYAGSISFNQRAANGNLSNAGYAGSIRAFEGNGTADNGVGLFSRTRMSFYINSSTPALTISTGGNVGINQAPAATVKCLIRGIGTDANSVALQVNRGNNSDALTVRDDGKLFYVFTSSGGSVNDVTFNPSTSEVYYISSSRRYKENIKDYSKSTLDNVLKLKVKTFDYINGNGIDQVGLIAEEVNEHIPELVPKMEVEGFDEPQPNSVRYSQLSVFLLKAIQEQQTIIEDLKNRIEKLEL